MEVDSARQLKAVEKLMIGLEQMKPKMIVITGRLFSEQATHAGSTEQFKQYVEALAQIVKDK